MSVSANRDTYTTARSLLEDLEAYWISLLLWVADRSDISSEDLISPLGPGAARATENYAKEVARLGGESGSLTVIHFLDFAGYVETASKNRTLFDALGNPPTRWPGILADQNREGCVRYRNHLSHGDRFRLLPPSEQRKAILLFQNQLNHLRQWWPACPVRDERSHLEENPIRSALRLLGPNEKDAAALVETLGMRAIPHPLNLIPAGESSNLARALAGTVSRLYRVGEVTVSPASAGLYLVYLDEWPERSAQRERFRRKVARALVEHQQQDPRWIAILLDQNDQSDEVEFILPRRREKGVGTVRATVTPQDPSRYHIELLEQLRVPANATLLDLTKRWNDAFNVERVTKRFYDEFRTLRDRLIAELLAANPDNPAFQGKNRATDKEFELHLNAFATRQLSRLLFMWFLQQKRWLGDHPGAGSQTYLIDLFRQRPKTGDAYFNDVLVPIFCDGLGRHIHDDKHQQLEQRFGPLPYLDGGLFRPDADPFEQQVFGIENGEPTIRVSLPDDLFDPAQDEIKMANGRVRMAVRERTVLGLLRSYRFTTQESTPDDQSVDPDPELLGKVFENLYQADDRHQTGAYYTPREIVHYMCRQALDGYLRDHVQIDQETLDGLRREAIDWQAEDVRLTSAQSSGLVQALDDVAVLDPAVGSGAFLVGMLQEIVLLKRGIWQAEHNADVERTSERVAEWKEHAIERNLYGVDINPMATEICRLRLWLSLVIEREATSFSDIHPLPNLDFRIVAGDSLVDRMGTDPFRESLPRPTMQPELDSTNTQRQIDTWQEQFQSAGERGNTDRMRQLSQQIREAQLEIARNQLDVAIKKAEGRVKSVTATHGASKRRRTEVAAHLANLEAMREGLRLDAPFQKPLLWPITFPDAFDRGGFDIVVANPPYVRQENIDAIDQQAYSHAFPKVYSGTADLYVYFYARAVQLLRDGGWLAFITSNKYMRANYGADLRAFLPANVQLHQVIDFGDVPLFAVAAYPAVVVGKKMAEPNLQETVEVADLVYPIRQELAKEEQSVNTENVRMTLDGLPALIVDAAAAGYPQVLLGRDGWILEDPVLVHLFDRLMVQGTPLGDYVDGRLYRGILTGLNEAFEIGSEERSDLIASDPRSEEVIQPWLRGGDIRRWDAEWRGLYLIAIRSSDDVSVMNPWAACMSERDARQVFQEHFPAIHDHLSRFEAQLRRRQDKGRFWWELRTCDYFDEFKLPKIIWPENNAPWTCSFAYDTSRALTNNKAYIIPDASLLLCRFLNSPVCLWLLDKLASKLRGGWLELRSRNVVGRLPVPENLQRFEESSNLSDIVLHEVSSEILELTSEESGLVWDWYSRRQIYSGRVRSNFRSTH